KNTLSPGATKLARLTIASGLIWKKSSGSEPTLIMPGDIALTVVANGADDKPPRSTVTLAGPIRTPAETWKTIRSDREKRMRFATPSISTEARGPRFVPLAEAIAPGEIKS